MKGKTILLFACVLLIFFFYLNINAFTITDVSEEFAGNNRPQNSFTIGSTLSWANVSLYSKSGLTSLPFIFMFWVLDAIFLSLYKKKPAIWKKIVMIIFSVFIFLFSLWQLFSLIATTGEQNMIIPGKSIYLFTVSATGLIAILYIIVSLLVFAAGLMLTERLRLPKGLD